MPAKSKAQKEFYVANIRKLMVIDHGMSLREMQHQLEENGIHLDLDYLMKLRNGIVRERAQRIERKVLSMALSAFEDVLSETTKLAWQVALSNRSTPGEKVAALREIRNAHRDAFDKLFDAGVFERKLGELTGKFSVAALLMQIKSESNHEHGPDDTTSAEPVPAGDAPASQDALPGGQ